MQEPTSEQWNKVAKSFCDFYEEPKDYEGIMFCTHPCNESNHKGNCYEDTCPLKNSILELIEAQKLFSLKG